MLGIYKRNGADYMFDNFIVNSFIMYEKTSYIIASVNNFGLVVIDCISQEMKQMIPINNTYFHVPPKSMTISTIIAIDTIGVRVLLEDEGGFSFFWTKDETDGPDVFRNFTVSDRFENINNEIPTKLLSEFKGGYAQVIKHPNNEDKFEFYLRVYIPFNHDLSKNYKEFLIDKIEN